MKLEFHQLDRRYEHLRVRNPQRQRRLLASLAASGQQTPIVVVGVSGEPHRYLVIDGYKRIAAFQQLGRDAVDAVVWEMSEAEALLLDRSMRFSEPESALEQGWLLSEFHQRFAYSLDEIARRFDRSASWVSRRLALVEILPESVQQKVRGGEISAQVAMKVLVPMARSSLEDCQRMADALARHRIPSRQAGQLYTAWRNSRTSVRQRILENPLLFLKVEQAAQPSASAPETADLLRDLGMVLAIANRAGRKLSRAAPMMGRTELDDAGEKIQRAMSQLGQLAERIQTEIGHVNESPTDSDSGTACPESSDPRDRAHDEDLPKKRAPGPSIQFRGSTVAESFGKGRTLPSTDPGAAIPQQRQSRPGP
jgi:ParB/RepB/Spo0J family partition protein